jgi:uncharacterized damage-inducible protein DinB
MARTTDKRRDGQPDRATILRALQEMYAGPAWHGPSVTTSLRGVSAQKAAWRPAPGRNSIWELVLHLAYGRYRLIRRLNPKRRDRFARSLRAEWWPEFPADTSEASWRADKSLLADYHDQLLEEVTAAPEARLNAIRSGQHRTLAHELLGVAVHDAYHGGQIRLLSKL